MPENAPEKAHNAAQVGVLRHEAAEEYAEGFAVGGAHATGSVIYGIHGFFDEFREAVELFGGGLIGREIETAECGSLRRDSGASRIGKAGDFIEADGDSLAEIHGGLGVGGIDDCDGVAPGEITGGEAVFFRAEEEGNAVFCGF